jgi:hypothetical protein
MTLGRQQKNKQTLKFHKLMKQKLLQALVANHTITLVQIYNLAAKLLHL